jgi:AAA domain
MPQQHLALRRRAVLGTLLGHVEQRDPLLVLKAPPGSGKTYAMLRAVALAAHRRQRVAVAAQTNAQADDLCRRLAHDFPRIAAVRYASAARAVVDLGASIAWARMAKEVPPGPTVVVATTSKWAASTIDEPYDFLFVDEAWQTCWADFMTLSAVAPRFVLVGDPGQIPPVVSVEVARWETSRRPPHAAAPEVILRDGSLPAKVLSLPVTTRLPHDTAAMVRAFYDFDFDAWSAPGERRLLASASGAERGEDAAIDCLATGSVAVLALPTPDSGPPLEEDVELAAKAVGVACRLLERGATIVTEDGERALEPGDIGLAASHRVMNTRMLDALGKLAEAGVRVDTPERWQGLERQVMIVIHPLSGVVRPSAFDLSTGRLCVMTSRHRVGLVILTRDHVGETLSDYLPVADQAVGLPDQAGRGHARHLLVWEQLMRGGRIVRT